MWFEQLQVSHAHDFRYYAAVNLEIRNETVGVIDVWRCATCHVKCAELRAQGLENMPLEAGFRKLDGPGIKWVLFVCTARELPQLISLRVVVAMLSIMTV